MDLGRTPSFPKSSSSSEYDTVSPAKEVVRFTPFLFNRSEPPTTKLPSSKLLCSNTQPITSEFNCSLITSFSSSYGDEYGNTESSNISFLVSNLAGYPIAPRYGGGFSCSDNLSRIARISDWALPWLSVVAPSSALREVSASCNRARAFSSCSNSFVSSFSDVFAIARFFSHSAMNIVASVISSSSNRWERESIISSSLPLSFLVSSSNPSSIYRNLLAKFVKLKLLPCQSFPIKRW
mmetsp:Transcript_6805/g.11110  ORF Transcript_6805/g.11110 Transcript_6805/m.11110 type:complete len:237 (-) Transcript_6805:244-954(-)